MTKLDRLAEITGRSVAWAALGLVLLTGIIVILRYLFQYGSIAMQEAMMYINALIVCLGAAYTLKEQGHVRVDIFYSRLQERGRAWVNLLGTLILLLPAMGFILWQSWDYVALSWRIREGSAEVSGLPLVYLLKTGILLLALTLILQGIAEASRNLLILLKKSGGTRSPLQDGSMSAVKTQPKQHEGL